MTSGKLNRCSTAQELLGSVDSIYAPLPTHSFDPVSGIGSEFAQPEEDPVDGIDVWRCIKCKLLYGASDLRGQDNICENCK